MKKKVLAVLSISSLILSAAMCVSFSLNDKEYEVEAYDSLGMKDLPTTIYLDDSSSEEIKSYYSNISSLPVNQRSGTDLLKNLKPILKNGQKYYNYTTSDLIWSIYEISDRDWEKSPASSITNGTYNSSANTIENYKYKASTGNDSKNPYIHALYINRDVENETRAWGNHNQDMWGINREHVWPKSAGFEGTSSAGGARGDPIHLIAGNGYVNNIHNNYFYGYVNKEKDNIDGYKNCGEVYTNQKNNYRGESLTIGSGTVFEPQDCDKGDIARAVFYMAARYNNIAGGDGDGIDSSNPNLEIVNDTSYYVSSGYESTATETGKIGLIQDLLEWNRIDPPDEYEIHRNNLLYKNYTNNRNPFIDYPKWADIIWGEAAGYANPEKADGIEGGDVTTLTLSTTNINTTTEKFSKISATAPSDVTISWEVEDSTVASLSKATTITGEQITITPLKAGETKINASATINEELVKVSCNLKITAPIHITDISLDQASAKLEPGDTLQLNVVFTPTDATNKDVTWSSSDTSVATVDATGKVTAVKEGQVTITVTTDDGGYSATCVITVEAKSILPSGFKLSTPIIIAIAVGGAVVLIVLIIILASSKKARKKVAKVAKKQIKKATKKSTKKK